MSRVLVDFVCSGRQQHRVFSVVAEDGGARAVLVHHQVVADRGSRPGVWRERPGPPMTAKLEDLPVHGMCACTKIEWWLYQWQVDRAVSDGSRRVVLDPVR